MGISKNLVTLSVLVRKAAISKMTSINLRLPHRLLAGRFSLTFVLCFLEIPKSFFFLFQVCIFL